MDAKLKRQIKRHTELQAAVHVAVKPLVADAIRAGKWGEYEQKRIDICNVTFEIVEVQYSFAPQFFDKPKYIIYFKWFLGEHDNIIKFIVSE